MNITDPYYVLYIYVNLGHPFQRIKMDYLGSDMCKILMFNFTEINGNPSFKMRILS